MSSIAYVTDQYMLEFHRLNGSKTMNFWRFQSTKNFTDFEQGDLLFFLAKGSERRQGKRKEKGIIGYGRLKETNNYSFKKMWDTYSIENGYATKEELKDAICKIAKDNKVPKKMNCLYLQDVVFFQSPVYLSEIGLTISNNMESFIYLDKEDKTITNKILQKGKESGVDLWASLINEVNDSSIFEEEEIRHALSETFKILKEPCFDNKEFSKLKKLAIEYKKETNYEYIKGSKLMIYRYHNGKLEITVFTSNYKKYDDYYLKLLGYLISFKNLFLKKYEYSVILDYKLLPNDEILQEIVKGE